MVQGLLFFKILDLFKGLGVGFQVLIGLQGLDFSVQVYRVIVVKSFTNWVKHDVKGVKAFKGQLGLRN